MGRLPSGSAIFRESLSTIISRLMSAIGDIISVSFTLCHASAIGEYAPNDQRPHCQIAITQFLERQLRVLSARETMRTVRAASKIKFCSFRILDDSPQKGQVY